MNRHVAHLIRYKSHRQAFLHQLRILLTRGEWPRKYYPLKGTLVYWDETFWAAVPSRSRGSL